jgi:hypothetical protein
VSAVLRAAKVMRQYQAHPQRQFLRGDPGILDSIWSGVKGAVGGFLGGGPLGAIAGGIGGLASGAKGATAGTSLLSKLSGQIQTNRGATAVGVALPAAVGVAAAGLSLPGMGPWPTLPGRTQPSDGGIPGPVEWMKNQGVRFPDQATGGCPSGYHPNKSGYYTKGGYVAPGTACVKNRKRNPLNPRAASRAMARLTSAKKATRAITKFFGESRRPARAISSSSGKKGCGCHK